jgi:hypothetical protein
MADEDRIPLDPTLGVNPTCCYCPVCGGPTHELVLVGKAEKYRCRCGKHLGRPRGGRCPSCDEVVLYEGTFDGSREKLPASSPCDRCSEILKQACLLICSDCLKIYKIQAFQVVGMYDQGSASLQEALDRGWLKLVTGKVVRKNCGCARDAGRN